MFLGKYHVAVAADGSMALPPVLSGAFAQALVFEPLTTTRGPAILARPGNGAPGDQFQLQLPRDMLLQAGIDGAAVLEGMGEYMIIRAAR